MGHLCIAPVAAMCIRSEWVFSGRTTDILWLSCAAVQLRRCALFASSTAARRINFADITLCSKTTFVYYVFVYYFQFLHSNRCSFLQFEENVFDHAKWLRSLSPNKQIHPAGSVIFFFFCRRHWKEYIFTKWLEPAKCIHLLMDRNIHVLLLAIAVETKKVAC